MRSKRQFKYDQEAQERYRQRLIDSGVLEKALDHAKGLCDMSATQVTIALKVMDKLIPSLQSQTMEVSQNTPFAVLPSPAPSADQWHKAFAPKGLAPAKPGDGGSAGKDTKH